MLSAPESNEAGLVSDIKATLLQQPPAAVAILFYSALRSTTVLPVSAADSVGWHLSYLGWHDVALFWCVAITLVGSRPGLWWWMYAAGTFTAAVLSFLANDVSLTSMVAVDGFVNLARLFSGMLLGFAIARSVDARAVVGYVGAVVLVLAATSVAVFTQTLETGFVRFFASGMSVASFAQVLAVTSLIFFHHRRWGLLFISSAFLLLTFSRATFLATGVALVVIMIQASEARRRDLRRVFVAALSAVIILLAVGRESAFDLAISEFLSPEKLETLSGRGFIWAYGWSLLDSGSTGAFGVGFGRTPGLLPGVVVLAEDGTEAQHFHSLPIELALGVGVLAVAFLVPLLLRLVATIKHKQYPAASIYLILIITQAVDFTLYRPKELLLWGFLLGLVEPDVGVRAPVGALQRTNDERHEPTCAAAGLAPSGDEPSRAPESAITPTGYS